MRSGHEMRPDHDMDSGRLTIRPATADDAPALLTYWALPETQQYMDRAVTTLEETRAFLVGRLDDPESLMYVIEHAGQLVGDIGGAFRSPHALGGTSQVRDFTLGYSVHPDHRSQGVATRAIKDFTAMLRDELGVRRIVAMVFAENTASLRALQRNGYRLEGTEKAAVLGRDGRWLDDCTLAHLPEDSRRPG